MAIGEALREANQRQVARAQARARGVNAKANRAAAARWVGGPDGSRMTVEELDAWAAQMRADFYSRHPELAL